LKIQKEQKKAMDVMINEKELKNKRDQLREELKLKKAEYKEKQNLLRKQEKQMREQHEAYISLEEKCRKLQGLINEKRAGIVPNTGKNVTEEDIAKLEESVKELEKTQLEEKRKYKNMITTQENKIKELNAQLDTLNLELKQKDQECRLNALKISELKRQIRLGAVKPGDTVSIQTRQERIVVDPNIAKGVEQIKKDMQAEKVANSCSTPEKVQPWEENAKPVENNEVKEEVKVEPGNEDEVNVKSSLELPSSSSLQPNAEEKKEEMPR
jgi:ethanolamine utilization protein EutQ (cupin superfamily)